MLLHIFKIIFHRFELVLVHLGAVFFTLIVVSRTVFIS